MRLLLIITITIITKVGLSAQTPVYDKSKHYQLRSMEVGPTKFAPKIYYRVLHNRYRKRCKPNIENRSLASGSSVLENEEYEKEKKELLEWERRELALAADREIDLVDVALKKKVEDVYNRFNSNLTEYAIIAAQMKSMEDISDAGERALILKNDFERELESLDIIKKAYIDNGKRTSGYISVIKNLENINESMVALMHLMYNKKTNIHFIK